MRQRIVRASCAVVLLQLIVSVAHAQSSDTSLVFPHTADQGAKVSEEAHATLGGIASLGFGSFFTFDRSDLYRTIVQPTLGFDFLAEPGGSLHFLLGGRLGFSDPLSAEASFGLRFPIHDNDDRTVRIYSDVALLFYADTNHAKPPGPGIRATFGARTVGSVDVEYRLAGEWRGTKSTAADENRNRSLWWIGIEAGVAFPLVTGYKPPTRKDSLRASLRYIATTEEMAELDAITSNAYLDNWFERFWKRRDPTPGTYINEARIEYERRVKLANEYFSRPKRMGVMTEAGRVFVIYGKPDDTEGATSVTNESQGYVLWVYRHRIETQPMAVFLFRTDTPREWQQVYSNVPGEMSGALPSGLPTTITRWIQ